MANTVTGKIYKIGETNTIPSKDGSKTFFKRKIVIDATRFDPYTGERGPENLPQLEFSGEKCAELDRFKVGDVVTVSFELNGIKYTNKDGKESYYTKARAFKIEQRQGNNTANAPQPTPVIPTVPKNDDLPF